MDGQVNESRGTRIFSEYIIQSTLFLTYMVEKKGISDEEKEAARKKLLLTCYTLEVVLGVVLVVIPALVMGESSFFEGVPLNLVPFLIGCLIVAVYYILKRKEIYSV